MDTQFTERKSLFKKISGDLVNNTRISWDKVVEREGLTGVLQEFPDISLESYDILTLDIKNPMVRMCNKYN